MLYGVVVSNVYVSNFQLLLQSLNLPASLYADRFVYDLCYLFQLTLPEQYHSQTLTPTYSVQTVPK